MCNDPSSIYRRFEPSRSSVALGRCHECTSGEYGRKRNEMQSRTSTPGSNSDDPRGLQPPTADLPTWYWFVRDVPVGGSEGRAAEASTWQGDEQREEECAGAAGNCLATNGRISPAVANTVPSTLSLARAALFPCLNRWWGLQSLNRWAPRSNLPSSMGPTASSSDDSNHQGSRAR